MDIATIGRSVEIDLADEQDVEEGDLEGKELSQENRNGVEEEEEEELYVCLSLL